MNMAYDNHSSFAGRTAPGMPGFFDHPDWAELRARLRAAREMAHMLSSDSHNAAALTRGSFEQVTALRLATYGADDAPVNPTASSNRKPDKGIIAPVAGTSSTGGRG
jgi:hypothetical protein